MKHPITPKERSAAVRHDVRFYLIWTIVAGLLMLPPVTPIGIVLWLLLIYHAATQCSAGYPQQDETSVGQSLLEEGEREEAFGEESEAP